MSDALHQRRQWFDTIAANTPGPFARGVNGSLRQVFWSCPCCGYATLGSRGDFEICVLCSWEDDGQDDADADEVRGGPNGRYSLAEARRNFSTAEDLPALWQQVREKMAVFNNLLKGRLPPV